MARPNAKAEAAGFSLRRFKAAVVQAAPIVFDRERTLEKVRVLAGEASRKGAQLVLLSPAIRGASTLALL